jgi:hypothetical protein
MPSYTMVKNGERVAASSNKERDRLLADGYTVEVAGTENDPSDREAGALNLAKGTLKLPVLAAHPAGPNAVGEVYVFTGGVVRVCTVAGSPGTWVNVGTQV